MRIVAFVCLLLLSNNQARADGVTHGGLLSNPEMALVYENARSTQELLLRDQLLSACSPYDAARNGSLSGVAFCKIETPHMQENRVSMLRGPDLYCSYLRRDYCAIRQPDWLK